MTAAERKRAPMYAPIRATYQTPNFYADRLMPLLTGDEWKLCSYAIRQTLGYNRFEARVSLSQFVHGKNTASGEAVDRGTGLSKPTVIDCLVTLKACGVLVKVADNNSRNEGVLWRIAVDASQIKFAVLEARLDGKQQTAKDRMRRVRHRLNAIQQAVEAVNSIDRSMLLTGSEHSEVVNDIDSPSQHHLPPLSTPFTAPVNTVDTQNPLLNPDLNPEEKDSSAAAAVGAFPVAQPTPDQTQTEGTVTETETVDPRLTPNPDIEPLHGAETPAPAPGSGAPPSPAAATRVVNIRDAGVHEALLAGDPDYVYCGRAMRRGKYNLPESPFANPFPIAVDSSAERRIAISKFKHFLLSPEQAALREQAVQTLRGKTLVCWCKPQACHCDAIAALVDGTLDNAIPAPEGHVTRYASGTGKTAHFAAEGSADTLCGDLVTRLLPMPKMGKLYRTCAKCERALKHTAKPKAKPTAPPVNEAFLKAVSEELERTPFEVAMSNKRQVGWIGTIAGWITGYERNWHGLPETPGAAHYARLSDELINGFGPWYDQKYPKLSRPTSQIIKYWSEWDRAGRPRPQHPDALTDEDYASAPEINSRWGEE